MHQDLDLAALASVGGFFALRAGAPPSRTAAPLARAYARTGESTPDGTDPLAARPDSVTVRDDPLAVRVGKVVAGIGAPEVRVGVSVAQQGLAARLWSLALGPAALYGRALDLDPALLHWDPEAGAPDDLWLTDVRTAPAGAERLAEAVVEGHLVPMTAALRARYRIAPGLLWGNAASALAGAVRELDRWAHRIGRPETAARARTLGGALLAHPALRSTGTLTGTAFLRRSCCLYYRCPGGGLCGDCCFVGPPSRAP